MKFIIIKFAKFLDFLISPLVLFSSVILKIVRKIGVQRLHISRFIFKKIGVFPINNHYHEPLFMSEQLSAPIGKSRSLSGINFNIKNQISMLNNFHFTNEFKNFLNKDFYFNNGSFEAGDAEYLYNFIRFIKPKKIIEVGCGFSTLIIQNAITANQKENYKNSTEHVCVEPYENEYLKKFDLKFKKKKIENIQKKYFTKLKKNDLLFIDSSHVIRPNGDVLFEVLELLPILKSGVYVHFHDIFSPYDYPKKWLLDNVWFWNEQYLLEAFLSNNEQWEITASLFNLKKNYYNKLKKCCNYLTKNHSPGSIYIKKK
jgi:hypothetical protein